MHSSFAKRALSPILGLLLFLQAGLVVTGGVVRITGSGLGCPTWPRCTGDSFTPIPQQVEGQLHSWIEFGNRLLTIALVLTSLLALLTVLYLRRRDIRALAIGQLLGIFAQIPLGGITVLTHLNPFAVASHFLLSLALIAAGTSLFSRREELAPQISVKKNLPHRKLLIGHRFFTLLVIVAGVLVTGSGPNAGDASAPRFHIRYHDAAWIHANLVIALFLFTVLTYLLLGQAGPYRRRVLIFLGFFMAQGAIGFLQFYNGLPEILVAAHLLGLTLVWISAWRIYLPKMNREINREINR